MGWINSVFPGGIVDHVLATLEDQSGIRQNWGPQNSARDQLMLIKHLGDRDQHQLTEVSTVIIN